MLDFRVETGADNNTPTLASSQSKVSEIIKFLQKHLVPNPTNKKWHRFPDAIEEELVSTDKELQVPSMLLDQGNYTHHEEHRTEPFVQTIAIKPQFADGR